MITFTGQMNHYTTYQPRISQYTWIWWRAALAA